MSVYPVLNQDSLKERCKKDIDQFIREQNIPPPPEQELSIQFSNKNEIQTKINDLRPKLNNAYVREISSQEPSNQQSLWIARTYLVYQLLIVLTISLQNNELYSSIFEKPGENTSASSVFNLPFRDDVAAFLNDIKLGIFGSLTPTSDIDIGFQYSGTDSNYKACLAYIVSRFEMLFLIFTNQSCLDYDVESYADMITVPNTGSDDASLHPDLFYLDTSKIEWNEDTKTKLLPIVFNSITRNAIIVFMEREEDNTRIESFTLQDVLGLFSEPSAYHIDLSIDITQLADSTYNEAFSASKSLLSGFLKQSYNQQMQSYYDKVLVAETLKVATLRGKSTIDDLKTLTTDEILKLIVAIGEALTFRMESYTCSPTVVHVVRVLQAEAQKIVQAAVDKFTGKYPTTQPKEICDTSTQQLEIPRCVVGKTGYIISALEQMGYMFRFYKTYCEEGSSHKDQGKCTKKMGKYQIRLVHANTNITNVHGGRGKRHYRSKTRKNGISKTTKKYRKHYKKHRNSKKMKRTHRRKSLLA